MKTKVAVRIISFSLAAVIISIGLIFKTLDENRRFKLELQNSYSRSLDDFSSAVNNISLTLNKAKYVSSPEQISQFAAKLLAEAELSKTALSSLPSNEELTVLNRFLSQVGNFALSVSKSVISGNEISTEQTDNISLLSDTASKISNLVSDSQISYNNTDYWAKELDKKLENEIEGDTLSAALSGIEDELSDYPTLIYDGPYSDHILKKEPSLLKNAESVSENEALQSAAKTAEVKEKDLSFDGFVAGNIPAYRFKGNGLYISVSKAGGEAVYMRKEREVGNHLLSYEQALEKAKRYLDRIDKSGMNETYYMISEGIVVINFAFLDGETICYTDLIKVGIALDNGEVMLYEASGFIANHTERAFETPEHTAIEAEEMIAKSLTIKSRALALIPTNSGGEVRCYEFACQAPDGQEILIYINASNLKEEDVLILLKSDGGILVK